MAEITGQIVDIDNVPLMGANVTLKSGLKSGKVGTTTDFDGNFFLNSESFTLADTFEVSYMGFISQTFLAKELKNKKIVLKEAIEELNEIVVVGTRPTQSVPQETNKNNIKSHIQKNKYTYAGIAGLLGIALLFLSIKKL